MKNFTIKSRRRALTSLALASATLPLLGVQTVYAQDELHPDWSSVWNQGNAPDQAGTMTVPANVVIPVTLDSTLSSAAARIGDIVTVTPISRTDGDSEFPPGTRIGGVISQVDPATKNEPGVLDIDFQSALLPDGTEVPLHGFIASLDSNAVRSDDGHLVARDGSHVNAWKAIGIGGTSGFVLGRLLKTSELVPTILGAAGGYLYARSKSHRGEDALINSGTTLGVRLESPVTFPDPDGYASVRLQYLEAHHDFSPQGYGWDEARAVPPTYHYDDYYVMPSCPNWVVAGPYDYFGFPLVPVFISYRHYYPRDPRWAARNSFWNRPDFHRGPRNTSWNNWNSHRPDGYRPNGYGNGSNWNNRPTSSSTWNNRPTSGNTGRPWNGSSWNRPSVSSQSNYTWSGSPSGRDNRYGQSTTTGNRTWVGRPQTGTSTTVGSSSKTTLPPIAPTANSTSSRSSGTSSRSSGTSSPRFDSSNNSSSRGAGGWGGARGDGGGGFRSSGGRGGFSGGGRSGRR